MRRAFAVKEVIMDEKYLAAIDAAYFILEEKQAELLSAIASARYRATIGWYNGHYHRNGLGEWERESYPIPVIEITGICDVEIGFDKITVSTKLPSKSVRMLTPENFTPYDYEVYGIEDYLNDLYNSRQPFGQLITSAEQHSEQEVGFSFYFPPQAPAAPILALIRLLDESGFYM